MDRETFKMVVQGIGAFMAGVGALGFMVQIPMILIAHGTFKMLLMWIMLLIVGGGLLPKDR